MSLSISASSRRHLLSVEEGKQQRGSDPATQRVNQVAKWIARASEAEVPCLASTLEKAVDQRGKEGKGSLSSSISQRKKAGAAANEKSENDLKAEQALAKVKKMAKLIAKSAASDRERMLDSTLSLIDSALVLPRVKHKVLFDLASEKSCLLLSNGRYLDLAKQAQPALYFSDIENEKKIALATDKVEALLHEGNYSEALALAKEFLKLKGVAPKVRAPLALYQVDCYIGAKDWRNVIETASHFVGLKKELSHEERGHFAVRICLAYREMGEHKKALDLIQGWVGLPGVSKQLEKEVQNQLTQVYLSLNEWEKVLKTANRCEDSQVLGADRRAYLLLMAAQALEEQGRFRDAMRKLEEIDLRHTSHDLQAVLAYHTALLHCKLGELDKAKSMGEKASRLRPINTTLQSDFLETFPTMISWISDRLDGSAFYIQFAQSIGKLVDQRLVQQMDPGGELDTVARADVEMFRAEGKLRLARFRDLSEAHALLNREGQSVFDQMIVVLALFDAHMKAQEYREAIAMAERWLDQEDRRGVERLSAREIGIPEAVDCSDAYLQAHKFDRQAFEQLRDSISVAYLKAIRKILIREVKGARERLEANEAKSPSPD